MITAEQERTLSVLGQIQLALHWPPLVGADKTEALKAAAEEIRTLFHELYGEVEL